MPAELLIAVLVLAPFAFVAGAWWTGRGIDPGEREVDGAASLQEFLTTPIADRSELERHIRKLVMHGFDVGDRTKDYALLVQRPQFDYALAILLALTVVGVFLYAAWFAGQKPEFVTLRVGEVPSVS